MPTALDDFGFGPALHGVVEVMEGSPVDFLSPVDKAANEPGATCDVHPEQAPAVVRVVGELDPTNIEVETLVNGERRQRFNTGEMVFSFWEYIEYLSRDLTLYPGDIISGGTAAGTAADSSLRQADGEFAPDRFLKPGDLVEIGSPVIGSLRASIVPK